MTQICLHSSEGAVCDVCAPFSSHCYQFHQDGASASAGTAFHVRGTLIAHAGAHRHVLMHMSPCTYACSCTRCSHKASPRTLPRSLECCTEEKLRRLLLRLLVLLLFVFSRFTHTHSCPPPPFLPLLNLHLILSLCKSCLLRYVWMVLGMVFPPQKSFAMCRSNAEDACLIHLEIAAIL